MQTILGLPHGQITAIVVVHTFGDYLSFIPHHILSLPNGPRRCAKTASTPLDDSEPVTSLREIFRNLFLPSMKGSCHAKRPINSFPWKISGFTLDEGDFRR